MMKPIAMPSFGDESETTVKKLSSVRVISGRECAENGQSPISTLKSTVSEMEKRYGQISKGQIEKPMSWKRPEQTQFSNPFQTLVSAIPKSSEAFFVPNTPAEEETNEGKLAHPTPSAEENVATYANSDHIRVKPLRQALVQSACPIFDSLGCKTPNIDLKSIESVVKEAKIQVRKFRENNGRITKEGYIEFPSVNAQNSKVREIHILPNHSIAMKNKKKQVICIISEGIGKMQLPSGESWTVGKGGVFIAPKNSEISLTNLSPSALLCIFEVKTL